jgi:hypothetical protein
MQSPRQAIKTMTLMKTKRLTIARMFLRRLSEDSRSRSDIFMDSRVVPSSTEVVKPVAYIDMEAEELLYSAEIDLLISGDMVLLFP